MNEFDKIDGSLLQLQGTQSGSAGSSNLIAEFVISEETKPRSI